MASKYDEDVFENPYFMIIQSKYPEYTEKVVSSKGILCVPKYSIAIHLEPSRSDIEDHILLPTNEIVDDDDDFVTISGKTVHLSDGKIVTKDGFDAPRQVTILFDETFLTKDGSTYRLFCIGGLLNRTIDTSSVNASPSKTISPTSYQQCIELLWPHSGSQKSRDMLDKMLIMYAATYDRLEGKGLRNIVDAANIHFTKALQLMLKDTVVRRSARHNAHYMENLKIAVETYVMNAFHNNLFRVVTTTVASQDAEINKVARNLAELQLSHLGIRKIFSENIPAAMKELGLVNRYSTPMGRLFCLKRVVAILTRPPKLNNSEKVKDSALMTTDDLLPIFIFLIIKSQIPNWMANLVYMRHFHFAKCSDDDEYGFYLASVEAALEHIRSGNIKDEIPLNRERWNSVLMTDVPEDSYLCPTTHTLGRQVSQNASIDEFFRYVQEGEEKKVELMLERPQKTSEEIILCLCHPLCTCEKCNKLLAVLRSNSDLVTAYTRDNRGYTALHMAAYYGQGLLIDLLIQNNAIVDATDYLGLTPLHLACQRGYQNVMLLLLHFGADIMAVDNENNTSLHMCCAHGHDDCVKALVFYDATVRKLEINSSNEIGDTPLHLAAKWGFEFIVKTLLENGADAVKCNRKKQTPVSLAQNVKVQRWLQMAAEGLDLQTVRQQYINPSTKSRSSSTGTTPQPNTQHSNSLDLHEPEISSNCVETASLEAANQMEKRKQKEKLFKAIIKGDIQLVKFYLGVNTEVNYGDDEDDIDLLAESDLSIKDMCHPLCQCCKCRSIQRVTNISGDKLSVNVRTSTGYCLLHMAVLHNHSDIVELLVSLGAEISSQNHKSLTPLHLACCMKNSLVTDILVKAHARMDVRDMNGDSPLLIAASNGFINGVQVLIKAGANLNLTNTRGNTALHEAARRAHHEIVSLLIQADADPRIANKYNKIPGYHTEDTAMQALLMATAFKLNESEARLKSPIVSEKNKNNSGQISIKHLFAEFESNDLDILQALNASVRCFDCRASLRHVHTEDKTFCLLQRLCQAHSIQSFDKKTLLKVQSEDKADPIHIFSLLTSECPVNSSAMAAVDITDQEEHSMTPMGDSAFFSNVDEPSMSSETDQMYSDLEDDSDSIFRTQSNSSSLQL